MPPDSRLRNEASPLFRCNAPVALHRALQGPTSRPAACATIVVVVVVIVVVCRQKELLLKMVERRRLAVQACFVSCLTRFATQEDVFFNIFQP